MIASKTKIPLSSLVVISGGKVVSDKESSDDVITKFRLLNGVVIHCMGKPEETSSSEETIPAPEVKKDDDAASMTSNLETTLERMQRSASSLRTYQTALETLQRIVDNIYNNPHEPKYRRVKPENPMFHQRLGHIPGALDALQYIGFSQQQHGEPYQIHPTEQAWNVLGQAKVTIQRAIAKLTTEIEKEDEQNSKQPALSPPPATTPASPQQTSAAAAITPQQDITSILSDATAVKKLLQDPKVESMLAKNPQMRPIYETLVNTPGMIDRISQTILQTPDLVTQAQTVFMNDNNESSTTSNTTSPAVASMPSPTPNDSATNDDSFLTEDALIAAAIQRSLEER